ncbi:leukocyte elastase inhibitor-like [Penaeus monodon]|uniref:leukocyte elastase inhibitor-like n=1 Tax=Penaeus monodon TaxID=6687 RepID=UPI0018A72133|nr:leukocyte elastase inhibitor-like [Penaeus monodon]
MKTVLLVSALGLWAGVASQCLSRNDNQVPPSQPDLNHILPFSIGLFKEVVSSSGNFFFSPYSIWTALVLTYFGAETRTKTQMEQVLQLTNKEETFALYRALNDGSHENNENYTLNTANRIFIKEGFSIRPCIQQVLPRELQRLNFSMPAVAAEFINSFVKNATEGKIQQAVNPGFLSRVRMLIVNAIYFKGLWEHQFRVADTSKAEFFTTPTQVSMVDMMTQRAYFRNGVSEELDADVVELPYRGGAASLFVLLPRDRRTGDELDRMLQRLTPAALASAVENLESSERILNLPKFKFEKGLSSELKEALIRMGIRDAFYDEADLSSFGKTIVVTEVAHKAVIEVNEEGSEAAAVTVVGIDIRVAPPLVNCNRPFLFFIRDNVVNNILFIGVFREPQP